MPARAHREFRRDLIVAILLAGVLTLGWTLSGWGEIARLRLPDTDDAMRLQQVRDWLGGQRFADLAQHRLGAPPGLAMHWSRLADLAPAAIIAAIDPLTGRHGAEIGAVIAWPALLFAAMLVLLTSIARGMGAPGPVAVVIAALAYPATTIFMPGRIDHHGLQLVLLLVAVRGAISPGGARAGAAAGLASAAGLAVGMEHAPLLALVGVAIVVRWVRGERDAQARLAGYAVALTGALAAAGLLLRTDGWEYPACDGFTATLWRAAQSGALAPLILALAGTRVHDGRARLIAALLVGAAVAVAALAMSPACLRPYGAVDPRLSRLWLAHVAEAQSAFAAPPALALGYAGLAVTGCIATLYRLSVVRDVRWAILAALQCAALAMTCHQLRGAYAAAALGVPGLAAMVGAARARGVAFALPAWIAAAGLAYPVAASAIARAPSPASRAGAGCPRDAILARLATLPPGRLLAPIDLGAYAVAATPHRVIAAPYHRNTAGNRLFYAAFLGPPEGARAALGHWGVTYLVDCPSSFAELGPPPRGSLLAALREGSPPAWLRALPGGAVYRVEDAR